MGLLLMQYEYQRAKQKCNSLQRKGIRLNDKHEMYTKRISNIQSVFTKKKTNVENKWSRAISTMNSQISSASSNAGNLFSVIGGLGISLGGVTAQAFLQEVAGIQSSQTGNGTAANQAAAAQQAELSALASLASQVKTIVQTTYEAMKEAELEELEAMEDAQLEPIEEKDSDMQCQIAENEVLHEMAKERMDAAKSKLPDIVKNSIARFGLS